MNFGCSKPDWVGLPYIHDTAIHGEQFYPRVNEISSLIRSKLDDNHHVFLTQSPQEKSILYSDEFIKRGFMVVPESDSGQNILEFYAIE